MMVLVCYDVETVKREGQRRLAKIAKTCKNYGQRVQNSVFECKVAPDQWEQLKARLIKLYKPDAGACSHCGQPKVAHHVCGNCGYYGEKQIVEKKA